MSSHDEKPIFTTEEQIAASHVGPLKPLTRLIRIVDYDPAWPAWFEREAERIRTALGEGVAIPHGRLDSGPEIQGVLGLANALNRVGLDHVLLVRVASTAVATALLGGWALLFPAFYLFNIHTQEFWWLLRFLLPSFPPLIVAALLVAEALVARWCS